MSTGSVQRPIPADGTESYPGAAGVPTILVVDDSPVDRRLAAAILEKELVCRVACAENGRAALDVLERGLPYLVLTDLQMPEVDGLALVEAVRRTYPLVPVVLMTAYGSEEVALAALRQGAAGYVPKRLLAEELGQVVDQVLKAAQVNRQRQQLLGCLTGLDSQFELENDSFLVPALVLLLQEHLACMKLCDETDRVRVGVALEEALTNALYHGNLGLSSDLRQEDDRAFYHLASERRRQAPYRDRRIRVHSRLSPTDAVYVIEDEGPGFDFRMLPDPTDPANLEKPCGRGLLLIRTFMDEVTYNDRGNRITLIKRRSPSPGP